MERLAEARKPLEDEIRALNEFLREKYEEVDKIELRASESLSELSEAEGVYKYPRKTFKRIRKQNKSL